MHDFNPKSNLWVIEKNPFALPILFTSLKYYDEATDTLDEVKMILHHLDGYTYEMTYYARLD